MERRARCGARRSRRRACRRGRAPGPGFPEARAAMSAARSSGTKRCSSRTKARRLAACEISVGPVRQKRPISRQLPGQAQRVAEVAPTQPAEPVGVAGADHQGRGAQQHLAVDRPCQVARRGTAARGRGPDRCWRGPGRVARAAASGSRRGRGRSAARPARPPAPRAGPPRRRRSSTANPAAERSASVRELDPRPIGARCR